MAHISLQAHDCRAFIKNGKLRFQAAQYDLNGNVTDQVTISFPLTLAYKFAVIENLDEETANNNEGLEKFLNRIQGLILNDEDED